MTRDKKKLAILFTVGVLAVVALFFYLNASPILDQRVELPTLTYSNPAFRVSLRYPAHWSSDPEFGSFQGSPLYFSGYDGYFGIDAVGAGANISIDDAVDGLAIENPKEPYGSEPSISSTTVDGLDARLILPSPDQPVEAKNEAALLVQYPEPVQIGDNAFLFFMLYGEASYIEKIGETLQFTFDE